MTAKNTWNVLIVLLMFFSPCFVFAENIDPANDGSQYAWGENVGWINFEPSLGPGVTVTDTAVTGWAWGENIGWVNLDPPNGGIFNDGNGNLSGFAWAENRGWINFDPAYGGVTINPNTGVFSGYAWGENIGWINFSFSTEGIVRTAWAAKPIPSINALGMTTLIVLLGTVVVYRRIKTRTADPLNVREVWS